MLETPTNDERMRPLRVLMVEPDADWRLLAELQLSMSGQFEIVLSAATLAAGVEALASTTYDVVLVGLGTPVGSDAARLDLLRRHAGGVPIVIASAASPRALRFGSTFDGLPVIDKMDILTLPTQLAMHAAADANVHVSA